MEKKKSLAPLSSTSLSQLPLARSQISLHHKATPVNDTHANFQTLITEVSEKRDRKMKMITNVNTNASQLASPFAKRMKSGGLEKSAAKPPKNPHVALVEPLKFQTRSIEHNFFAKNPKHTSSSNVR